MLNEFSHARDGLGQMHGRNGAVGGFRSDATIRLLTMNEITDMFRVKPRTVTHWVRSGMVTPIRLPGGSKRFRAEEIRALLRQERR